MRQFLLIVFLLVFSSTLQALGLGEIQLHSYLNAPFSADVFLIDADSISAADIKASLGTYADYEKLALPHDPILSELQLNVTKNASGRPIIHIQSEVRVQTPYLVLLVNIVWPHGDVFHTYTILLDPPRYGLKTKAKPLSWQNRTSIHQDRDASEPATDDTPTTTYGPTLVNENVWQIAKRYKLNNLTLPQVVLGVVGNNPEAFEAGNLNGLKPASLLNIPSSTELSKISANLAAQEVEAHDIAWRAHTPIHHVIPPPYLPTPYEAITLASSLPSFSLTPAESSTLPVSPLFSTAKPALSEAQLSLETKLKTLEETHLQLMQTLRKKEQDNQNLRKEIQTLKQQIIQLKKSYTAPKAHSLYLWFDLLILLGIIACIGWWYQQKTQQIAETEPPPLALPVEEPPIETPLKDPKALQALLEVAKTYLAKGETLAAKQALEEVAQYGDENQKKEALDLINNIP